MGGGPARARVNGTHTRCGGSLAAMLPMGGDAIWGRTGSDAAHLAPPDAAVLQGGVSSMLTLHGGVARALDGYGRSC